MELELFCEKNGIEADFIETSGSAETAEDAARELDTTVDHIIKSLVFFVDGEPVLVVVRGSDRVAPAKVAEACLGVECRIASPDEVKEVSGFHIGGVPPVGTELVKVIDEQVLEMDTVYGGGGSATRIVALDPRFMVAEDDVVADVTA